MCVPASFPSRLPFYAIALGFCAPLAAVAQNAVPAPPTVSPSPVAQPIEAEETERSLIPVPGFLNPLKKDEPDAADPLLDQTSGAASARPDLSEIPVSRIEVPELESVPEADLPAILRSKEVKKSESGPFGLFGKDDPVVADPPVARTSDPALVPIEAAAAQRVEDLRAAETQADSFAAALAVAQGATVAPVEVSEPVVTEEKDGMLSSIGGLFKKDEPAEDPVADEKRGLFSGLFGGKDKEPEALATPVPGISDIGEPAVEEEKKGFRLPKLFGRE